MDQLEVRSHSSGSGRRTGGVALHALHLLEQLFAGTQKFRRGLHSGIDPAPVHFIQSSKVRTDHADLVLGEVERGHSDVHPGPGPIGGSGIFQERAQPFGLCLQALSVQAGWPVDLLFSIGAEVSADIASQIFDDVAALAVLFSDQLPSFDDGRASSGPSFPTARDPSPGW